MHWTQWGETIYERAYFFTPLIFTRYLWTISKDHSDYIFMVYLIKAQFSKCWLGALVRILAPPTYLAELSSQVAISGSHNRRTSNIAFLTDSAETVDLYIRLNISWSCLDIQSNSGYIAFKKLLTQTLTQFLWLNLFYIMALPVVEFSREGYKIRKVFG